MESIVDFCSSTSIEVKSQAENYARVMKSFYFYAVTVKWIYGSH